MGVSIPRPAPNRGEGDEELHALVMVAVGQHTDRPAAHDHGQVARPEEPQVGVVSDELAERYPGAGSPLGEVVLHRLLLLSVCRAGAARENRRRGGRFPAPVDLRLLRDRPCHRPRPPRTSEPRASGAIPNPVRERLAHDLPLKFLGDYYYNKGERSKGLEIYKSILPQLNNGILLRST